MAGALFHVRPLVVFSALALVLQRPLKVRLHPVALVLVPWFAAHLLSVVVPRVDVPNAHVERWDFLAGVRKLHLPVQLPEKQVGLNDGTLAVGVLFRLLSLAAGLP